MLVPNFVSTKTSNNTIMKLKFTLCSLLGFIGIGHAQLAAGDIAFVGFNADGDDDISFVTFKNIPANTTIYFCDSEWNGTGFGTDEGDFTWSSGNNAIAAGTVIAINSLSAGINASAGSITLNNAGGLSTSGDAMFAFLGTAPRMATTMLAAISNSASGFGTLNNSGLTLGTSAIVLAEGTDIALYNGPRTGLTQNAYLSQLNTPAQWQTEDTSSDDHNNGTTPDMPFNQAAFAIGSAVSNPAMAFSSEYAFVNENSGTVSVNVVLSTSSATEVTAQVAILAGIGNAQPGIDFDFAPQTITFPANSSAPVTVNIPITDNVAGNPDKFFVLAITGMNGADAGSIPNKTIYILDDENLAPTASAALDIQFRDSYLVDGNGSAEIVAFDAVSKRLFVLNSTSTKVNILDFSNPDNITPVQTINMTAYGIGATSVAYKNGIVAASVESANFQNGKVVLMDVDGNNVKVVEVGVLPDMVTFTPDGMKILTANEGQPKSDYSIDPEGSISVIDVSAGLANVSQASVSQIDFHAFDSQMTQLKQQGVRIFGPGASVSQDFEPEYITVSDDGQTAWVTLQENNAIAVVDLAANQVTAIHPLGLKDHSLSRNSIDFSDQSPEIFLSTWPVKGMYLPDAIANYTVAGTTYLVTANEGDVREYDALEEEIKVGNASYILDPTVFPNAALLKKNNNLGRLAATNQSGDIDGDGDFDEIHAFGTRSFSIWNAATGALVYDSGDDFERITASDPVFGALFNASNDNSSFKNRSDNKGPEPEGITVAQINGAAYAFITLERIGGVMAYDITDPQNPVFVSYKNNRTPGTMNGDLGPEGIIYINPENSPTNKGLIVMANEVSATISVYEIANDALKTDVFAADSAFAVYPNPVNSGILHFSKPADVTLYDLSGRKVTQKKNASYLDVSAFSKGIYLVKTASGICRKVIID